MDKVLHQLLNELGEFLRVFNEILKEVKKIRTIDEAREQREKDAQRRV